MFLLFILLIPVITEPDDGQWTPNYVTRKTILRDNENVDKTRVKRNLTTMAFVERPRGYKLARNTAARLDIVSPTWFEMDIFVTSGQPRDLKIDGFDNVNDDFIVSLRKANPDIWILPRFRFRQMDAMYFEPVLSNEKFANKMGFKIVDICRQYGFDGATIEFTGTPKEAIMKLFGLMVHEAMAQIGKIIRNAGLKCVYSLPPPVTISFDRRGKVDYDPRMTAHECKLITDNYDFVHLKSYDAFSEYKERHSPNDVEKSVKLCGNAPNLLSGINFYGVVYPLKEYRQNTITTWKSMDYIIDGPEYLKLLEHTDAELSFGFRAFEHTLVVEPLDKIVFYPSMTSIEFRIAIAKSHNMGVAFGDYGQGLFYFSNLI